MIQRHMTDPDDEDLFKSFDYYNDFNDTIGWLNAKIANAKTEFEKERLKRVIQKLKECNEKWLEEL